MSKIKAEVKRATALFAIPAVEVCCSELKAGPGLLSKRSGSRAEDHNLNFMFECGQESGASLFSSGEGTWILCFVLAKT